MGGGGQATENQVVDHLMNANPHQIWFKEMRLNL